VVWAVERVLGEAFNGTSWAFVVGVAAVVSFWVALVLAESRRWPAD
jgi:hypothetical protein